MHLILILIVVFLGSLPDPNQSRPLMIDISFSQIFTDLYWHLRIILDPYKHILLDPTLDPLHNFPFGLPVLPGSQSHNDKLIFSHWLSRSYVLEDSTVPKDISIYMAYQTDRHPTDMRWQTLTSSHPCFHRDRKPTVVNSLSSSDSTVMSWKVHLPQTSDWVSADSSTDTRWRTNLVPTDATTFTSWQLSGSHKRQDRTRDDRQSRLGNSRFP